MNGKSQPGTISRPLKAKQTSTAQHLLDCNPKSPNTPASNAKYSTNLARFWNEVRKFRVETGKFCETVNIFIAGEPFQAKAVWPCPGFLVLEQYPKSINMSRLNYSILKLIKIDLNLTVRLCSPCLAFLVLQNPPDLEALLGSVHCTLCTGVQFFHFLPGQICHTCLFDIPLDLHWKVSNEKCSPLNCLTHGQRMPDRDIECIDRSTENADYIA